MNPGPDDQQSHGHEYPPLADTPTPPDAYPPVDYPTNTDQPPAYPGAYPGAYDVQPTSFPYPGPPEDAYQQSAYPPPPMPGAPYQGYPGQQYPGQQYGGQQYGGQQYGGANPYGYDPYRPAQPVGTNGKAIAALVTSLVGLSCCGLPGVVGIILGVMAMRETKQTGQDGHGLALAGVIVGALSIGLAVFGVVFGVMLGVWDDSTSYSTY